jgi:hypothetical protein
VKTKVLEKVVIVYPNQEQQDMTSEELKMHIKNKLNPKEMGNIGIKNIRKIKNDGIIIECNDKKECQILENNINEKLHDLCEAKIPLKKNLIRRRLIIYNLFNDQKNCNESSVMDVTKESIIAQNQLNNEHMSDNEDDLKCKYFIKSKNENYFHLVIEVSPKLRKSF